MDNSKESVWSKMFGICLLTSIISFILMTKQEDATIGAFIFGGILLFAIVVGIISMVMVNVEKAKSENKSASEYLDERFSNSIKETKETFNIGKAPKVNSEGKVICPHCGSTNIQVVKRGWKVTTGFLGSSKNERVCVNCMKKI